LKQQYGHDSITDDDVVTHVIICAGTKYKSVITSLLVNNKLNVANLESEMYLHWQSTHGLHAHISRTNLPKAGGTEMTFTDEGGNSDGSGRRCWKCGSTKHVKAKCPQVSNAKRKKATDNSGGTVKHCYTCGKNGHGDSTCSANEANAHKRPAWYKPKEAPEPSGTEHFSVAVDKDFEFLFCALNTMVNTRKFQMTLVF
jgi:hypothetical protein